MLAEWVSLSLSQQSARSVSRLRAGQGGALSTTTVSDLLSYAREHGPSVCAGLRRALDQGDVKSALAIVSMFEMNTSSLLAKIGKKSDNPLLEAEL